MSLPALLMIHGMWSRPSTFTALRGELEASGIRSAAITLPYHDTPAGSPPPDGLAQIRIADYVAALEREAAAIDGPLVVVGHSMGGLLAQLLAARIRPVGLILLATAPSAQAAAGGAAISLGTIRTLSRILGRKWGWWKEAIRLDEEVARESVFNGVPEAELRPALAELAWDSGAVLRQVAAPFLDADKGSRVDYERLTMPSLVIAGRDDRIVDPAVSRKTARLLAAAGSRVDYEEWPGAGHWLFHDAVRPRLAAAISRFLLSL